MQEQLPRVKRAVGEVTYTDVGNADIVGNKYLSPQKKTVLAKKPKAISKLIKPKELNRQTIWPLPPPTIVFVL